MLKIKKYLKKWAYSTLKMSWIVELAVTLAQR